MQAYLQQQEGHCQQQAARPAAAAAASPGAASGAATPQHHAASPSGGASPLRTPAEEVIVYRPTATAQQQQQQQQQAVEWSFMPISPYTDHELALSPIPASTTTCASAAAPHMALSLAHLQRGQQCQQPAASGGGPHQPAALGASSTFSELGFRLPSSPSPVRFSLEPVARQAAAPPSRPAASSGGGSQSLSLSLSLTTMPEEAAAALRVPYADWRAGQASEEPALADTAGSGGAAASQEGSSGRFSLSTLPSEAARAGRVGYSEWQQQLLQGAATPAALADTAASRAAVQGAQQQAALSSSGLSPLAQADAAITPDFRSLSKVSSSVAAASRIGFEQWQQQVRGRAAGRQAQPSWLPRGPGPRCAAHLGAGGLTRAARPAAAAGPRQQPAGAAHAGGRHQQERQQPAVPGHPRQLPRRQGGPQEPPPAPLMARAARAAAAACCAVPQVHAPDCPLAAAGARWCGGHARQRAGALQAARERAVRQDAPGGAGAGAQPGAGARPCWRRGAQLLPCP
jgi:hypothetical protein